MIPSLANDRKLPIYLLIDTSVGMSGVAMNSMRSSLLELKQQLVGSPETLENGLVSLILFSDDASLYEFTPIDELDPPEMIASGGRSVGAALHVLVESLQHDLDGLRVGARRPQRPLAVLVISGPSTDAYEHDLNALLALPSGRRPTLVVLPCGDAVDTSFLQSLRPFIFPTGVVTPETLAKAFGVVTRTIIGSSRGVPRDMAVPPLS